MSNALSLLTADPQLQLQVNTAGAWKTVLVFDVNFADDVCRHVQGLQEIVPGANWRITACGRLPLSLAHIGRNTHSVWVYRRLEA